MIKFFVMFMVFIAHQKLMSNELDGNFDKVESKINTERLEEVLSEGPLRIYSNCFADEQKKMDLGEYDDTSGEDHYATYGNDIK